MRIAILSRGALLYSTQRLLRAAMDAGHEAEIFDYALVNATLGAAGAHFSYQGEAIDVPELVIGRVSPTYTPLGIALLAQFGAAGAHVSPAPEALATVRDKWRAQVRLRARGVPMPAAAMVSDARYAESAVRALGGYPVVVKLLESTHGAGVVLAPDRRTLVGTLDAFASLHRGVLVQEYIADEGGADLRVIVVGGAVVAAMRRTPAPGDFRSNLHRGGSASALRLAPDEEDVALRAAAAAGLAVAGVDLLRSRRGPLVLEVNASPGLEGIEGATGVDVAAAIVGHLAGVAARAPQAPAPS